MSSWGFPFVQEPAPRRGRTCSLLQRSLNRAIIRRQIQATLAGKIRPVYLDREGNVVQPERVGGSNDQA